VVKDPGAHSKIFFIFTSRVKRSPVVKRWLLN